MAQLKICIVTIFFTILYLLSSVLFSNLLFYNKSHGSLIKTNNGKVVGSKFIGQEFKSNLYFHNRPSFYKYKNNISGSSNLSYYSFELKKQVSENYVNFISKNNGAKPDLNLICESASGLDPHITYEGAISQVERIAKARGVNKDQIIKIVNKYAKPRIFGLFGEKIVNVLEVNLKLKKGFT